MSTTDTTERQPISDALRACVSAGTLDEAAIRAAVRDQFPPHAGVHDRDVWHTGCEIVRGAVPGGGRWMWRKRNDFALKRSCVEVFVDL